MINGQQVKRHNKMPANEKAILFASFVIGYSVTPYIIKK